MVDGPDSAWRNRAPGPHRNTARQAMDGLWTEVCGQQKQSNDPGNNQHILNTPTIGRRWHANGTPCHIPHSPNTPTTGLPERGNDTSKSTGRSGRQEAATRLNMRREERVTVQGPVKEQQPDGMSHRGGAEVDPFPLFPPLSPRPPNVRAWGAAPHSGADTRNNSSAALRPRSGAHDNITAHWGCFGRGVAASARICGLVSRLC